MVATRVATFAQQQLITNAALRTQRKIAEAQLQIATGKKTQEFSGLAADASRLVTLKGQLSNAQQFIQNIVVTEKRLNLMEFSLEQIDKIARTARTDLLNSFNGSTANRFELASVAQGALDQVVDILNLRDDSRFLFAGGKVTTKPVDLANGTYTAPTPPPFDTTADLGYYEGDNVSQSSRIDEGFVVQYGIKANESAFERLIRAFDTISNTTFSDPITAAQNLVIDGALAELNQAIDNNGTSKTISDLVSDVGLDRVLLDSVKDKHLSFIDFSKTAIGDIENVDIAEAIANLQFEQIQLEASFATIARVQTLTLNDFLR